jgi:rhodanese-related sulfurtransferase
MDEWKQEHLPGAQFIPLPELRNRLDEIRRQNQYIIYDATGTCSAVVAMILLQNGVKAYSLSGGINHWRDLLMT